MLSRFVVLCLLVLTLDGTARAAINVGRRTGDFKVVLASGESRIYAAAETLPPVIEGSVIEVLGGEAEIATTEISTVRVVAGFQTVIMGPGAIVNISYDLTNSAAIQVLAGDARVSLTTGSSLNMMAGDEVRVGAEISGARYGVNVLKGEVPLIQPDGRTIKLTGSSGN